MRDYISPQDLARVKKLSALDFYKNYAPDELVRVGRNDSYCLRSHDSIKLSNGLWCWWSNGQIGGRSALDLLIKVEGYDFLDAANYLKNLIDTMPPVISVPRKKKQNFCLPYRNDSDALVRLYLIADRHLDPELVDYLLKTKIIYEEAYTHNAVFLGFDETGLPAYAFKRGVGSDFKQEAPGSNKAYSFQLANAESEDLHIFESAIDLLSWISILKMDNKDYRNAGYLSMGGVTDQNSIPLALVLYLERYPQVRNIYIHFDSDGAGFKATTRLSRLLQEKYTVTDKSNWLFKDVNEALIEKEKKKNEQISRSTYGDTSEND